LEPLEVADLLEELLQDLERQIDIFELLFVQDDLSTVELPALIVILEHLVRVLQHQLEVWVFMEHALGLVGHILNELLSVKF